MLCKYQLYVKNFPFSARQVGRSYKCTLGFSFSLNSFGLNIYANICSIHKSRAKMSLYPMLLPININKVQHAATHFIQTFSKNTFHTNNNYVYQKKKKKNDVYWQDFPEDFPFVSHADGCRCSKWRRTRIRMLQDEKNLFPGASKEGYQPMSCVLAPPHQLKSIL